MSATADHAETNLAVRLGFQPDQVVQEIGYDDDADQELREAIEAATGTDLVDEEYDDVADAVVLWFREDDGDLTDALVDSIQYMEEGGSILLLTPKTGRDGYIFNVILNGVPAGAEGLPPKMPGYSYAVSEADAWAIVAYVRALQTSQAASLEDVPADVRSALPPPPAALAPATEAPPPAPSEPGTPNPAGGHR